MSNPMQSGSIKTSGAGLSPLGITGAGGAASPEQTQVVKGGKNATAGADGNPLTGIRTSGGAVPITQGKPSGPGSFGPKVPPLTGLERGPIPAKLTGLGD